MAIGAMLGAAKKLASKKKKAGAKGNKAKKVAGKMLRGEYKPLKKVGSKLNKKLTGRASKGGFQPLKSMSRSKKPRRR